MKKLVFLIKFSVLLLLSQFQLSIAQTSSTIVVELTPSKEIKDDQKTKNLFWVKYGSVIKTKFVGVNSLRLNGASKIEFKDFNFEVPELFQTASSKQDTLEDNKEIADRILFQNNTIEESYSRENIEKDYKMYWDVYSQIARKSMLVDRLKNLVSKKVIFVPNPQKLKERAQMWYSSFYNDPTGSLNLAEAINSVGVDFVSLESLYTAISIKYQEISKSSLKDEVLLDGSFEVENSEAKITINKLKLNPKMRVTPYDDLFKKLKSAHAKLMASKENIQSKSLAGIELLFAICDSNFEAFTDNGTITTDQMIITPILKDNEGNIVHEFKPRVVRAFGQFKVNASAGYLLSFIRDDNYDLVKDTEGNTIGVKRQKSNVLNHAAGSLINVYRQSRSNISFGASAGLSIDSETNVGFYLGVSALAFNKNRLVITTGLSFTKKQVLNTSNLRSAFDENSDELIPNMFDFISPTDTELSYHDLYKPAFFIGLTYNFTN